MTLLRAMQDFRLPCLSLTGPGKHSHHPSQFSPSEKKTEINSKSCFSSSFLLSENYLWGKMYWLPPALPPTLGPQSLSVVDSLMVISVRISVLQNGKRSMTSSKSMFHLYHSWGSAAVDRLCEGRGSRGKPDGGNKKNMQRHWGVEDANRIIWGSLWKRDCVN